MNSQNKPRTAWAPFFISIISYVIAAVAVAYFVLASRLNSVKENVDFQYCTQLLESQGELAVRICAQNELAWYMSDPHHLARLFVLVLIPTVLLGLLFSSWGLRKGNKAMWLAGLVATLLLFTQDRTMFVPAVAVFVGHLLAMGWSSRRIA